MRLLFSSVLFLLLPLLARADDLPPNKLTPDETVQQWILLFDGETVPELRIEGSYEIVDGTLVLGGAQMTRAYLKRHVHPGFEMRFQYRTEGTASAGIGWDNRRGGKLIPGLTRFVLTPEKDWRESFLQEYFDIQHPWQRFIKHQLGANGVFDPVESVWVEVPPGNRLYLRNMRLGYTRTAVWEWLFTIAFIFGGLGILFVWRRRKKYRKNNDQPKAVTISAR